MPLLDFGQEKLTIFNAAIGPQQLKKSSHLENNIKEVFTLEKKFSVTKFFTDCAVLIGA